MTHSGAWDEALRILRDPIFGLAFAVLLALIGKNLGRLLRLVFWLGSIVVLIWLAAHNSSSAHVEVAVVAAVTRVLLIGLAAVIAIVVIGMAVVLVMYLNSAPSPSSSLTGHSGLRLSTQLVEHEPSLAVNAEAGEALQREGERFASYVTTMMEFLEALFSTVDEGGSLPRGCAQLLRVYFSGLSGHSAAIGKLHDECDNEVGRLARLLAQTPHAVSLPLADMSHRNWFPNSHQWAVVAEDLDFGLPHLALRVICLKADWRAVAMILYKAYACSAIVAAMAGQ